MVKNGFTVKFAAVALAIAALSGLACKSAAVREPEIPPKPADECPEREVLAALELPKPFEISDAPIYASPHVPVESPADQAAYWRAVLDDLRTCNMDDAELRRLVSAVNAALRAAEESIENP